MGQLITAGFKFQLINDEAKTLLFLPIAKTGNNFLWDTIYAQQDCQIKQHGPMKEIEDYVGYSFRVKGWWRDLNVIILNTSKKLYPLGIGKGNLGNDCYLFRVTEDSTFEVFICPNSKTQSAQLLQLFMDGSLNTEIDEISQKMMLY